MAQWWECLPPTHNLSCGFHFGPGGAICGLNYNDNDNDNDYDNDNFFYIFFLFVSSSRDKQRDIIMPLNNFYIEKGYTYT